MSRRRRRRSRRKKQSRSGNIEGLEGISPKAMQRALGQIDTDEIENVTEVIVRTDKEEIILQNPEVTIMNMGQEVWNVVPKGTTRRPLGETTSPDDTPPQEIEIKEEDVDIIVNTTDVSREEAIEAIRKNGGDIAAAIMSLK